MEERKCKVSTTNSYLGEISLLLNKISLGESRKRCMGRIKAKVKEQLTLKLDKLMDFTTCPYTILL